MSVWFIHGLFVPMSLLQGNNLLLQKKERIQCQNQTKDLHNRIASQCNKYQENVQVFYLRSVLNFSPTIKVYFGCECSTLTLPCALMNWLSTSLFFRGIHEVMTLIKLRKSWNIWLFCVNFMWGLWVTFFIAGRVNKKGHKNDRVLPLKSLKVANMTRCKPVLNLFFFATLMELPTILYSDDSWVKESNIWLH